MYVYICVCVCTYSFSFIIDLPTNKFGIPQQNIVRSKSKVTIVRARGPNVNSVTAAKGYLRANKI